jgi:diadenylate cyclase
MITAFIDFNALDLLDIILVALIIYQFYFLIRGTAAIKIFVGILLIYLLWKLVSALQMEMLGEILGQFIGVGVIALLIVFQQELRNFLLFVGNRPLFRKKSRLRLRKWLTGGAEDDDRNMTSVVSACKEMSESLTGALIVITNQSDPTPHIAASEYIDGRLSKELLTSIFYKNNPLHDGAVHIRGNRIVSARGLLPANKNPNISGDVGMRHRAALGLSELTDAYVVVVSEQNGSISVAQGGKLHRDLTPELLERIISKTRRDE